MGLYTTDTDTDEQKLKPVVRRQLEHRLQHMPGKLTQYLVTRRIVLKPHKGVQRFEDVTLHIQAGSMSDACRMADEAKAARDYNGHQ
jgi:hypothetical protein